MSHDAAMQSKDVYRIAGEAGCDPRTVQSWLEGSQVRPMVAERIAEAVKKLGLKLKRGGK